jgi:1,2-dihydroxy-3-keto-5-methylthiopentene dioxygenase
MAIITLADRTILTQPAAISAALSPLNVQLQFWEIGTDSELNSLLDKQQLTDDEKERVLTGLDRYFEHLQQTAGYRSRDAIVLHPDTPNLTELLAKFAKPHTHADDEVRYVVAGAGIFGFVLPDGEQLELTIEPGEYINVPKGTEHWFRLTATSKIKAIRYFTNTTGWTPEYTQTEIKMRSE